MTSSTLQTRFEIKDVLKVLCLNIVLFGVFIGLINLVPGADQLLSGFHPSIAFFIQYAIQLVILFFPLWFFVVNKYNAPLSDFGFVQVGVGKLLKSVVLTYLLYILFTSLVAILLIYSGWSLPGYETQESYIPLFGYDALGLTVALLMVGFIAPFLEEFFFRGFLYRVFVKTWSLPVGDIITALLFALVHFQLQNIVPLFILGLLLNYVYRKTGSVWAAVAFHSLNNLIAYGVDIYFYFHPDLLKTLEANVAFIYNAASALF